MSKPMSLSELTNLLEYVKQFHSPMSRRRGRTVKYVHPNIDMRDGSVFSITFRQFGGEEVHFYTQNEFRDVPETLFERCLAWLIENPYPTKHVDSDK
jgi:hypothetical protein